MKVARGPTSVVMEEEGKYYDVKFTASSAVLHALYCAVGSGGYTGDDAKMLDAIESAAGNKKGNKLVQVKSKPVQVTVEELTLTLSPQEVKCLKFLLEQFEENCYMAEDEGGPEGGEEFKDNLIKVVEESFTRTAAANKSHPN